MEKNSPGDGYIVTFDALRGIAVIIVMVSHFLGKLWYFSALGQYGVTLFFVLSGYLITRILLDIKKKVDNTGRRIPELLKSLQAFYMRRTLRIFPLYYVVLIILVILNIDSAREYWQYYFFYISNYLYPNITGYNRLSHFWTLAVEEQFYLIWPVLILFFLPARRKIFFFLVLVFLSLVFRYVLLFGYRGWAWAYLMPSSISLFALGALALVLKDYDFSERQIKKMLFLFIILTAFVFVVPYFINDSTLLYIFAGSNLFFAGTAAAIVLLMVVREYCKGWVNKVLHNKYLLLTGKISYGIYVVHMFVPGLVGLIVKQPSSVTPEYFLLAIIYMIISVIIAFFSFFFFEQPLNNLKRKFQY